MRLGAITLGFGLLLVTPACRKPAATELTSASQEVAINVETAVVAERATPESLTLTGTLRASQESEVAADAAGKVTATYVERGQQVKQGDTLAILDSRGASLSAAAAVAQSGAAKTQLDQALRECERVASLFKQGAISQAEYDRTTAQCSSTQYSAQAALAQQQSAQKALGDMVIRAPFAGVVGERYVNVGQYVQPPTRVVSLYAPDPLRLELTIPEASIGVVKVGQPVAFSVAAFRDKAFTATIRFISPNIRPATRDLVVEALAANPDLELKPGMFTVARLEVGEKRLPAVPSSSLRKDDSGVRAFVVVDKRVQERVVQVGGEREGFVGIVAGVKAGESVVVNPGPDVREGAPVR